MTEYHKIYKVMGDNIWASTEVFNNVHPRLGGLHTIMNSSGSVGNLWWCRHNVIILWAAVFTFNPYLLISINELLISIIHLLISIIHY